MAAAIAISSIAIWLLEDAATKEVLISAFGLMASVAVAYFGIKVGNDAAERAHSEMQDAHGREATANRRADEANKRAEGAHQRAQEALAALGPRKAKRIRRPPGNYSSNSES
jgi:hypothetical protein